MSWQRFLAMLAAALAWLTLCGSASAAIVLPYNEPEAVREVRIPRGLESVAQAFWSERGVALPPNPELLEMVAEPEAAGRGDMPGRRVWIAGEYLRGSPITLCTVYLHERGHNAGLPHSGMYWIMDPAEIWTHIPPPRCVFWSER